jgi:hypothetical protein
VTSAFPTRTACTRYLVCTAKTMATTTGRCMRWNKSARYPGQLAAYIRLATFIEPSYRGSHLSWRISSFFVDRTWRIRPISTATRTLNGTHPIRTGRNCCLVATQKLVLLRPAGLCRSRGCCWSSERFVVTNAVMKPTPDESSPPGGRSSNSNSLSHQHLHEEEDGVDAPTRPDAAPSDAPPDALMEDELRAVRTFFAGLWVGV